MQEKTFVVTHPKARQPLTITGKTLKAALKVACLDPTIWKLAEPPKDAEEAPSG